MATTIDNSDNPPQEENSTKTLTPTEPIPDADLSEQPNPAIAADNDSAAESKVAPATAEDGSDAPISDAQKKIRRAERFGITVQLSEKEKRNSRAERFGTSSTTPGSETSNSEELKRKARAERFGIPGPTTTVDETKKKARLARFSPASKAAADPAEEDKRKARALRFSNSSSGSLSQVNSKGRIEPDAVIAGKAGGGD
ncbi:unnamed protein product [Lupinus luteus]|uniref:THO1-MOS11 C-terminal domain-containing protein n=1 Tax=Lupinus luteus TaxID=3873 RepID=A0AAV1WL93_LUPLU